MGENQTRTVRQVIDLILAEVPGGPLTETVDTIKTGDPSQVIRGIATTFLATYDVIQRAAEAGANFIITHEPTFYSHADETDWLGGDPVYERKQKLIAETGMAIWRFHDHIHRLVPDGIVAGMLARMGWEARQGERNPAVFRLPGLKLSQIVESLKASLGADAVRVTGDPNLLCNTAGLSVGFGNGRMQMGLLRQGKIDLLVAGEILEWEAAEYMRDAVAMGLPMAMIVLGHAYSEEAGMEWLVDWLQPKVPGIPVTFLPAGAPYQIR